MLSLQECLDFTGLSEEEIDAIAEHEHVPDIIAAEIGSALLQTPAGLCLLRIYLSESIERARARGQHDKAERLLTIYRRFVEDHPESASSTVH